MSGERHTPWKPRRLDPDDAAAREAILSRFPGGAAGVELPGLAAALRVRSIILAVDRWRPVPTPEPQVVLALRIGQGADALRATLSLSLCMARLALDLALARAETAADAPLSSGEQGALLYLADAAGGDWLASGGGAFVLCGILADAAQTADYLGGLPRFETAGRLEGEELSGPVRLAIAGALPASKAILSRLALGARERAWPIRMRVVAARSRVPSAALEDLAVGDRITLDEWTWPGRKGGTGAVELACGGFRCAAAWSDARRLTIVSNAGRRELMDTRVDDMNELPATLEQPVDVDKAALEVVVQVEVGRVSMPLGKALGLVPGRVLRLDREVGPRVHLRVGDKLLGCGELVELEGGLAVEITEVS
ncbi:MAG: FliM/FliN family flagellar motor switch protein [Deltaproteobacteria bacterium]|nr:FliM/FliN family flagellar motor switch protein [Deltaproteobacteria bacterium]